MDLTNVFTVGIKLRRLMVCHDKAVQQMSLLAEKLAMMDRRFDKMDDYSFPARKCHLLQRYCMIEWIHNMYDEYRLRKWVQIQMFINFIFSTFHSENIMDILLLANVNARSLNVLADEDSSDESDSDSDHMEGNPSVQIRLPHRRRDSTDSNPGDLVMLEQQVSTMDLRSSDTPDSDYETDSSNGEFSNGAVHDVKDC